MQQTAFRSAAANAERQPQPVAPVALASASRTQHAFASLGAGPPQHELVSSSLSVLLSFVVVFDIPSSLFRRTLAARSVTMKTAHPAKGRSRVPTALMATLSGPLLPAVPRSWSIVGTPQVGKKRNPLSRRPVCVTIEALSVVDVRQAVLEDAASVAAIYSPNVNGTAISFEEMPPTADECARRIERALSRWQWLIAETGGSVVGYAYGSQHRERAAYRWSVEVSVYVDVKYHRRGVGRALYGRL